MGGIENGLDRRCPMLFLASRDVALGEVHIAQYRAGIGPLPKEVVVLEEMVVAKGGVSDDQRLQSHGILFHEVDDAGIGIDHQLISEAATAFAVEVFLKEEAL